MSQLREALRYCVLRKSDVSVRSRRSSQSSAQFTGYSPAQGAALRRDASLVGIDASRAHRGAEWLPPGTGYCRARTGFVRCGRHSGYVQLCRSDDTLHHPFIHHTGTAVNQ